MKGGRESFIAKLERGKNEAVDGAKRLKEKTESIAGDTYRGALTAKYNYDRNLDAGSGYSSLYSTPIIKQGGKKNRRRRRKTRRKKRKTKRRTKRRRRTSKRRKRRR